MDPIQGGGQAPLVAALAFALATGTIPSGALGDHDEQSVAIDHDRAKALFDGSIPDDIHVWAAQHGALVLAEEPRLDLVVFDTHSRANASAFIDGLRDRPDVRWADHDVVLDTASAPGDPAYDEQYGPQLIDAPEAWAIQEGNHDTRVAVLDAGVDGLHPDLQANCGDCGTDTYGHGTPIAGVVAAGLDNGQHIAGMAQVEIVSHRAVDGTGQGHASRVAIEIVEATAAGADVIALSLAGECDLAETDLCPELRAAVEQAWQRDAVLVAATGNHASDHGVLEPAAIDEVLAVGSVGPGEDRSSFSNGGPSLDVVAPGEDIVSTAPPSSSLCGAQADGLCTLSGTSMAAAHVAGVAGLVRSECPSLTNDQVVQAIASHARDRGEPGVDHGYGHGLVDADDTLAAAC